MSSGRQEDKKSGRQEDRKLRSHEDMISRRQDSLRRDGGSLPVPVLLSEVDEAGDGEDDHPD